MGSEQLDHTEYDVLLLGTSLVSSILSSAAARIGKRVLHLDSAATYGGANATFTLNELLDLVGKPESTEHIGIDSLSVSWHLEEEERAGTMSDAVGDCSDSPDDLGVISESRKYALDLLPFLLHSRGAAVNLLIASNVGRYVDFKLLDHELFRNPDASLERLPCSRQDIFTSRSISLVEKRVLTRFLTSCVSSSSVPDALAGVWDSPAEAYLRGEKFTDRLIMLVLDAVSLSPDPRGMSVGDVVTAVQRHVRSAGQYGDTAFIVPMYGSSEMAQAFCRLSAIYNGTFILNSKPDELHWNDDGTFKGARVLGGQDISVKWLVTEPHYTAEKTGALRRSERPMSCALIVCDGPLLAEGNASFMVAPSGSVEGWAHPFPTVLLQQNDKIAVCPPGKVAHWIVTRQAESTETDLSPFIDALFGAEGAPRRLLTVTFRHAPVLAPDAASTPPNVVFDSLGDAANESFFSSESAVLRAKELFGKMFPGETFLPAAPDPDDVAAEMAAKREVEEAEAAEAAEREAEATEGGLNDSAQTDAQEADGDAEPARDTLETAQKADSGAADAAIEAAQESEQA